MCRAVFNAKIRPQLTEITVGVQGIAFDRLELDVVLDQYKSCFGRPSARKGGKYGTQTNSRTLETW